VSKPPKEPKNKEPKEMAARPVKQPVVKSAPAFQPIQSPTLPISGDKQQRLSELLQKYRNDEITPEQYHEQRAQILAQP